MTIQDEDGTMHPEPTEQYLKVPQPDDKRDRSFKRGLEDILSKFLPADANDYSSWGLILSGFDLGYYTITNETFLGIPYVSAGIATAAGIFKTIHHSIDFNKKFYGNEYSNAKYIPGALLGICMSALPFAGAYVIGLAAGVAVNATRYN